MKRKSVYIILPLLILLTCQKQERPVWSDATWKDSSHSKIVIENTSEKNKSITISYFNKTTREKLDSTLLVSPGSKNSIEFKIFRPELVDISYGNMSKTTYLLPEMDLELILNDSIQNIGEHSKVYLSLLEVGDNTMTSAELEAYFDTVKTPSWLQTFLYKSRAYKESYDIYHDAGYQLFIGNSAASVSTQDSISSELLLADQIEGIHYNYYSLLQSHKYNYELRKLKGNLKNEFFELRQNLLNKLKEVEDDESRYNMIAMHTEGLMLRKRKEFKDKDLLYTRIISLLPEDYVDKLNKIEKEYATDDYDLASIQQLLTKEISSLAGEIDPLNDSIKDYKLLKFWFAGCAPCKKQIPHENELLDQYENLSILHFCKSTEEAVWREYISKNNSKGMHFYLDEVKSKEYKSVFDLSYSPRYVLLDKSNNVVCWNCPNPSNARLEELLALN